MARRCSRTITKSNITQCLKSPKQFNHWIFLIQEVCSFQELVSGLFTGYFHIFSTTLDIQTSFKYLGATNPQINSPLSISYPKKWMGAFFNLWTPPNKSSVLANLGDSESPAASPSSRPRAFDLTPHSPVIHHLPVESTKFRPPKRIHPDTRKKNTSLGDTIPWNLPSISILSLNTHYIYLYI